jgi:SPP1 gp7 family putative phage head morphogenesis protein
MPVNANTEIYDKTLDRAAMIRLYERRVNGKVKLVLDGHAIRVDTLIREAKASDKGFTRLREAIDQDIQRTFKDTYNISKRSLEDLANDQLSYTSNTIDKIFGDVWKTERPPSRIAEDIVLNQPLYNNKTLQQGWTGIAISERKRLEALIRKGIADGDDVNTIADNVRKTASIKISRNQSKTLVVTAVTSVQAQVDQAVYKANDKAIVGWQYVAVLDSRTTPLCAHRDGTIYPPDDTVHLPPAHYYCRSTTVPVFKSWDDMAKLDNVAQIRRRNLQNLSKKQIAYYDGQTPLRESYHDWLSRQDQGVQLKHLGDYQKVELFQKGQLQLKEFTNAEGNTVGIRELRAMTDGGHTLPNDTKRFAVAKEKLDSMQLWATTPDDLINDSKLRKTLQDYYILQSMELDGTLSLTNYRGTMIGTKKAVKNRVLTSPPREDQIKFNPITNRYEDVRLYQPNPAVYNNNLRLIRESDKLLPKDKEFILKFIEDLDERMGINERAVIADNLRIIFSRFRDNKEIWGNFKAVVQGQIKFDVMNVSDFIETQIRKDSDILKKLLNSNYLDPVLGPTQLREVHDSFIDNIRARNKWEDKVAPKIARELRNVFDYKIAKEAPLIWARLDDRTLQQFYLKFAHRLSLADMPDRDNFAVALGRDLHNLANFNGNRRDWYKLGMKLLEAKSANKFYEVETFGVQKRRMKSRMSGKYFGPYYDTVSYNIRITDKRIQEYAKLNRKIDLGLRVPYSDSKNQLIVREGYKTYWIDRGMLGYEDTRIPITSTSSFSDFPDDFIDKNFVNALNWASKARYKVDEDFYDFIQKLLYFEDDRGKAKYYNELNELRKHIASRGDSYERFKAMEWLRKEGRVFSNQQFIDHRARIYERGLIGPQAGETFRPFLNTAEEKILGIDGFRNFQDQVGAFLGGLNDYFEGRYNGLSFTGRQKIAEKWRPEMVKIGNHMLRGKPADLRAILEADIVSRIDGDELPKFYRLAIEYAKLDNHLKSSYTSKSLSSLNSYKTALALEQDASSSGAQIIALTTKNKQLAEFSNVIPTAYKKRIYDEVARDTFNDPRFRELNKRLGITEKDLRKAVKYQNMVTLYGAGERTAALQVENWLAKPFSKQKGVLVVTAADREKVLGEISARMARYEKFDSETFMELKALRKDVKDVFDKGMSINDELMEQLYFLDPRTRDLVEKMTMSYDRVVTPTDFRDIARIASEYLEEKAPIIRDFTRYFGRLAEDYLANAKPSNSDFDWKTIGKMAIRGNKKKGFILPDRVNELLGVKAGEPVSEKVLKRFGFWKPDGTLSEIIYGVASPDTRRTGAKYFKIEIAQVAKVYEMEIFYANKLPKRWTNVPWVNFDKKVLEQNFTQTFEERLAYRDKFGNWVTNILHVPQKTDATWWEEVINKSGKINDIADLTRARTAFAVNGNHSNDATIVKNFHLWGSREGIETATVHDAFFTNIADMLKGRKALRKIYADTLEVNIIEEVLKEMRARGFPKELYDKYMEEAIEKGLIPIPGKSKIGDKVLTEKDILKIEDILQEVKEDFSEDYGWYGVG